VEVKLHTFDTLAIDYMKCCIFGERALGTTGQTDSLDGDLK